MGTIIIQENIKANGGVVLKRFLSWTLGIIACFGLLFMLFFLSFHFCLNDDGWFKTELYRLDTARKSGHRLTELTDALDTAQTRLSGNTDASGDLSSRELSMLDAVAKPVSVARIAFFISAGVCALFFLTVPFALRREWILVFSRSCIISAGVFIIPATALMVAIGTSFSWLTAWARYLFALPAKLSSDSLLGALFSDNLLYDLISRALKIGLVLTLILLAAAIAFLVIRAKRRRSAVLASGKKQTR